MFEVIKTELKNGIKSWEEIADKLGCSIDDVIKCERRLRLDKIPDRWKTIIDKCLMITDDLRFHIDDKCNEYISLPIKTEVHCDCYRKISFIVKDNKIFDDLNKNYHVVTSGPETFCKWSSPGPEIKNVQWSVYLIKPDLK